MDDLKAWYRERLAARIDALEAARRAIPEQGRTAEDSIRRLAHSLRGSGGTFGYPEVTETAAAVEEASSEELAGPLESLIGTLRLVVSRDDVRRFTLLVVGPDDVTREALLPRLASPTREVHAVASGAAAERVLDATDIALVLLDLALPDVDGRNLLVRIRERARTASLPVFVMSDVATRDVRTECFALGADEVFEKPVDPVTLSAAVAAKLERAAGTNLESRQDALTRLPNRAALRSEFDRACAESGRVRGPVSLALVDIDGFKTINDLYGHRTGDEVLQRVAQLLSESLRGSDTVGRWGGEEFVLLYPGSGRRAAARATERALMSVRAEPFVSPGGTPFHVTFSAGVVEVPPNVALEDAVDSADKLLYAAKGSGRGRVVASEHEAEEARPRILLAEDDLDVSETVARELKAAGYDVVTVGDGAMAMAALPGANVALAILDVRMPVVDGFHLIAHFRREPSFSRTPILVLTALSSEQDVVRAFELGADDYVVKPFNPLELLARVRRLLRRS